MGGLLLLLLLPLMAVLLVGVEKHLQVEVAIVTAAQMCRGMTSNVISTPGGAGPYAADGPTCRSLMRHSYKAMTMPSWHRLCRSQCSQHRLSGVQAAMPIQQSINQGIIQGIRAKWMRLQGLRQQTR